MSALHRVMGICWRKGRFPVVGGGPRSGLDATRPQTGLMAFFPFGFRVLPAPRAQSATRVLEESR